VQVLQVVGLDGSVLDVVRALGLAHCSLGDFALVFGLVEINLRPGLLVLAVGWGLVQAVHLRELREFLFGVGDGGFFPFLGFLGLLVLDLLLGLVEHVSEILHQLVVLSQILDGKLDCLLVGLDGLLEAFQVLQLHSHIVVGNGQHCDAVFSSRGLFGGIHIGLILFDAGVL